MWMNRKNPSCQRKLTEFEEPHLYIVWDIYEDLNPERSNSLIARCLTCRRSVGVKDAGNAEFPSTAVLHYSQICQWQTTKAGINKTLKLAKQKFSKDELNTAKEKTH